MEELEKDTWYWVSDPGEGDIFHPVLMAYDAKSFLMDGYRYPVKDLQGLRISKAIMPDS